MGICLGLQLFFGRSEEAPECRGLGLLPGTVRRFRTSLPVPHVGWARCRSSPPAGERHPVLASLFHGEMQFFYHVHSYHPAELPAAAWRWPPPITTARSRRSSGQDNVIGAQFHPEKSQKAGIELLSRFVGVEPVTTFRVAFVDVYVLRQGAAGLETLVLRRAPGAAAPAHGRWSTGASSRARRRGRRRCGNCGRRRGSTPARLYNLSRVESFYRHGVDEIGFIPVFAAFVAGGGAVRLSAEHDGAEWLSIPAARGRLAWPRERRALEDIQIVLARGDAGPLEDVLRVERSRRRPG